MVKVAIWGSVIVYDWHMGATTSNLYVTPRTLDCSSGIDETIDNPATVTDSSFMDRKTSDLSKTGGLSFNTSTLVNKS